MTRTRSQYVSPIGVLSATNFITSGVATITNTRGTNANYSGIITANNVIVGAAQTSLVVLGDARITGILTVGTASITFDGNNNRINVGSAITFNGSTGIISATEFRGNGANLTGVQPFPSGTLMLFQQTASPTGWTKQSTHDNKSLRVVTGAASSGGSTPFTSIFAARTPSGSVSGSNSGGSVANTTATGSVSGSNSGGSVNDTTLSTNQIPTHNHLVPTRAGQRTTGTQASDGSVEYIEKNNTSPSGNAGLSGSHTHGFNNPSWSGSISINAHNHSFTNPSWSGSFSGSAMDFAVQYVDLIIAAKD
jgi:hypothetical protein